MDFKNKIKSKFSIIILSLVSLFSGMSLIDYNQLIGTSDLMLTNDEKGSNKILQKELSLDISLEVIESKSNPIQNSGLANAIVYNLHHEDLTAGFIVETSSVENPDINQIMRKLLSMYSGNYTNIKRFSIENTTEGDIDYTIEKGLVSQGKNLTLYAHKYIYARNKSWLVILNYKPDHQKKATALLNSIRLTDQVFASR